MARMKKVRLCARAESGTSYLLDLPTGVAAGMLEVEVEVVELLDVELEVLEILLEVVELLDVGVPEAVELLSVGDIFGDEELVLSPTGDDR
jgi:hypothetical protein